jgi:hypothetical protein
LHRVIASNTHAQPKYIGNDAARGTMTTHPYSEEHLVEQPAIELFAALGWQTVSAQVGISECATIERTGHA